jgi:hypothetical protein
MDEFWLMLGGCAVATFGALVGSWMTRKTQADAFAREVGEQRAERFRVALGEVTALSREIQPDRVAKYYFGCPK